MLLCKPGGKPFDALEAASAEEEMGALSRECLCAGFSDPGARAGDENDFALETGHGAVPLRSQDIANVQGAIRASGYSGAISTGIA
jgi:hypothetical protein